MPERVKSCFGVTMPIGKKLQRQDSLDSHLDIG